MHKYQGKRAGVGPYFNGDGFASGSELCYTSVDSAPEQRNFGIVAIVFHVDWHLDKTKYR